MTFATSADRDFTGLLMKPESLELAENSYSIRSQVIVTEFQGQKLVFPSAWVEEVMLFPRQRVLQLPFYRVPVLGLVPHQGDLVLLLESQSEIFSNKPQLGQQENMRAIRLGDQVEHLAGAAILIDKIIGTVSEAEVTSELSQQIFAPEAIALDAFTPYRWN